MSSNYVPLRGNRSPFRRRSKKPFYAPSNKIELACYAMLIDRGFTVWRTGWPDLLATHHDERRVVAVEVKTSIDDPMPEDQIQVCRTLAWSGLEVYRWSPDSSFKRILASSDKTAGDDERSTPLRARSRRGR